MKGRELEWSENCLLWLDRRKLALYSSMRSMPSAEQDLAAGMKVRPIMLSFECPLRDLIHIRWN